MTLNTVVPIGVTSTRGAKIGFISPNVGMLGQCDRRGCCTDGVKYGKGSTKWCVEIQRSL